MQKNTASQKIGAQMISASDGSAFTGSVTVAVTIDAGTQATGSVGSGACTHEGGGYHTYAPAQAETNGALIAFTFSGTGAIPVTVQVFTTGWDKGAAQVPANVTQFGGSNGTFASGRPEVNASHIAGSAVSTSSAQLGVNVVNAGGTAWATVVTNLISSIWASVTDSSGVTTLLSRLSATRAGYLDNLSAGAVATASALTSAAGDVTSILGKLTGITSLAQWLGLLAGKQTGNSTARTELRATGAGSGTFDETTDSQEALRDRGDAAWTTATGFSTLDAAGVRGAVGLASANLDTQLSGLAQASDLATADGKIDTLTTRLGAPADFGGGQSIAENLQDMVGSPTFDASTDSLEALRNRGDSAWGTADVSGLATASALTTVDGVVDAIKAKTDNLPASPAATGDIPSAASVADAVWEEAIADHEGTAGSTAEALANAGAAGTPPTAGEIADAVWDEAQSGHGTSGTFGAYLDASVSGVSTGGVSAADIADAVLDEALSGHTTAGTLGKVVADTAAAVDTEVAAIKAKTDNLPSDPADASDIASAFAAVNSKLDAIDDYVDTEVAAIKAKTDLIPASPAATGDIPSAATVASAVRTELATELGRLDVGVSTRAPETGGNLAAVKAKTDNLPASPAAVGSAMTLTSAYDAAKTAATQTSVDDLPTNAELATALAGADDAVLAAIAALNNLSASGVRSAVGLASANLDTQLGTIAGYLDTEIAAIISALALVKAKTDNLPSDPADQSAIEAALTASQGTITAAIDALNDLSATAAATGLLDLADGIETGLTLRQALRLIAAASAGKVSGADTSTVTIRSVGDTVDRIVATVDEDGNRTAVTTDVS